MRTHTSDPMRCVAALCTAALIVAAGCDRESAAPRAPDEDPARPAAPAAPAAPAPPPGPAKPTSPPRLPEDPIAGKRSEEQWREHLREEERERQMSFDRRRMKQHRALLRLITSARAQYDRARTEAALSNVRKNMPKRIAELQKRMHEIDPDRNSSRVLADYEILATALADTYPEAKLAALEGDAQAFESARAEFDQRTKKIDALLEEAAESEGEYE